MRRLRQKCMSVNTMHVHGRGKSMQKECVEETMPSHGNYTSERRIHKIALKLYP